MSSETTEAESAKTPIANSSANAAWLEVRGKLRSRALRARIVSGFAFLFIVGAVVTGALGIWYANDIAVKIDPSSKSSLFGSAYSDFGYSELIEQAGKESTETGAKPKTEIEKLKEEIDSIKKLAPQIADTQSAVSDIKSRVDSVEGAIQTVKAEMGQLRLQLAKGSPRLEVFVAAFATRFVIAALAFLLVKILTSIYRYHARLAAHFDSKADALELCPVGDVAMLEKLCLALSTAGVDFQESADSIAEHAVDIARKVMPKN